MPVPVSRRRERVVRSHPSGGHAALVLVPGLVLRSRLATDGPPLDPSSAQARDWLAQELAKSKYHTAPSLWERFLEWLRELLNPGTGQGGSLPVWGTYLAIALLLLVIAALVLRVVRREARTRPTGEGTVLEEPGTTAEQYRRRAAQAAGRGDWDSTVLDSYRAVAQGAVERTILDDLPGRTAHEVATELAPVFPVAADELRRAAAAFDAVRYGHLSATEENARVGLAVEVQVRQARPVLPEIVAHTDVVPVERA